MGNNKNTSERVVNKVVVVNLTSGLIGFLTASPRNALNSQIQKENEKGWRVIQIIPSESGNIFLSILRLLILVFTLFLYTQANGYYIVLEKIININSNGNEDSASNDLTCNKCGEIAKNEDAFCENCGTKL